MPRRCCCEPGAETPHPCEGDYCVSITLEGIEPCAFDGWGSPHYGYFDCPPPWDSTVATCFLTRIVTFAGVNGTFVVDPSGDEFSARVVLQAYPNPDLSCGPPAMEDCTITNTTYETLSIAVVPGCRSDGSWGIDLVEVDVHDSFLNSHKSVFSWSAGGGEPALPGTPLPNQRVGRYPDCNGDPETGGPQEWIHLAGTAVVQIASEAHIDPETGDWNCGGPRTYTVAVDCATGSRQISVDIETAPGPNAIGFWYDDEAWYLTTEATGEPPVSGTWLEHGCVSAAIGERCDTGEEVLYDPSTQPSPAHVTFMFDGHRYLATGVPASGQVEDVIWSEDSCPGTGEYYYAHKCAAQWPGPSTIVYERHPDLAAGEGVVTTVATSANEACPGLGSVCFSRSHFVPTADPAPGPATASANHRPGGCGPRAKVCEPCNDGGPIGPPGGGGHPIIIGLTAGDDAPPRARAVSVAPKSPGVVRKAYSLTRAVVSGRKASERTISLRQLSCFGDEAKGVAPCPALRGEVGQRYCSACGCGSRKLAILDPDPETGKSKLQFAKLDCPLRRAGFSNAAPKA